MIFSGSKARITPCEPGVTRKVLAYTDELMLCEVTFQKGAEGCPHAHPHTQATYVVKGRFEFTVAGETKIINQGDSVLIPGEAQHCALALEDGVLLDAFTPMRREFV
jgi:quercetin dioxygenase-like cupin family protein